MGHGQQKVGKKLSPFRKSKLKIILKLQVFFFKLSVLSRFSLVKTKENFNRVSRQKGFGYLDKVKEWR